MRRIIFGGLVAVTLGLPAVALAKPTIGFNTRGPGNVDRLTPGKTWPANGTDTRSIGAGMEAGNEPGHVTGPGNSPIDNSVRGPINDVQPGHGTTDTRQNAKPKPVY